MCERFVEQVGWCNGNHDLTDFDDDRMDIDIPRQIPGVSLNGGPVFEDDF
jgi:hypothetical protein